MINLNKITSKVAPLRASEWWESKFGPLFGTIYATSFLLQIPFISLFPFVAFLLIALLPGASFVSIINDLTDLEEDKLAGKNNRLAGKSTKYALILILICLILGTIISVFLSKISFILYLSAWIVFTLYSVPPMRLKHRGIWGILADSLGANVFPQLFAVSVLFDWFGQITDFRWFGLIGIWSFLLGLRGIVSHQMTDKKNDQIAGVQTFVQNLKNKNIKKFFNWIIFPIEMGFLILILYYSNNFWGFGLLVFYFIVVLLMRAIWEINFRSVISSPKERMLMNEFYFLLYPISYLIAGLTFFVSSGIVFILHLVGFYPSIKKFFFELKNLLSEIKLIIREFILGY